MRRRVEGELVWHKALTIRTPVPGPRMTRHRAPRPHVTLGPVELFVVPRGIEHRRCEAREVKLLRIEQQGANNGTTTLRKAKVEI